MDRKIPKKNYIIYAVIVIATILVVLYLNSWYKAYKQNELDNSYISKYINELNYEEFKNFSIENPNLIVYIGKTNCENCIKVEKELYLHPTIKPLEIIKKQILHTTQEKDIVLDCFCGSGTTCVAAKETNRHFIGMEINEEYWKIANNRLNGILANGQMSIFSKLEDEVEHE